jgi:hypothetical protein
MKENTNEVQETTTNKVDDLAAKGDETVKKVWPKVKKFALKTLPYAICVGVGVVGGTLFAGRPAGMTDSELEDAGVDLNGQKPEA